MKGLAIFEEQRATRKPLQLQERVKQLLDILTHFDMVAPSNADSLTTENTFFNPVIILKRDNLSKYLRYPSIEHDD